MSKTRGRPPTFTRRTKKYFARLIQRHGVRGAREASKIPVSQSTLTKVAKEFGIRLQVGRRRFDATKVPEPRLSDAQKEQLGQILSCGASAAGYRSDQWTCRRIADIVQRSFGVKCHVIHLKSLLSKLGFRLVERHMFLMHADKFVARAPVDDSLSAASRPLKAA